MSMGVITLLTDFGLQDEFVGVVKGVILGINPQISIVDISHQVPAQGIMQAGEMLLAACGWFPKGTIHLSVVDPGVGSDRAVIVSKNDDYWFVAPDNGLLTAVWSQKPPNTIVRVENNEFFLKPVSVTFHGRDVFAPLAAHLSKGIDMSALGPRINLSDTVQLNLPQPSMSREGAIVGQVVSVDRFGNLITNITSALIDRLLNQISAQNLKICIADHRIDGLSITYAHVGRQGWAAVMGSRNKLEIAVNGGRAADFFESAEGLEVQVSI